MKLGIYIPGLGYGRTPVTLSTYAQNFARSLDKNDENKLFQYSVEFDKKVFEDGGKQAEFEVADIRRKLPNDNTEETIYRFYEYNYESSFTQKMNEINIFRKSLKLLWGFSKMAPVFILSLIKKGQSFRQKMRSLYFFAILVIFSFATALLLPSLVTILIDNIPGLKAFIIANMNEKGFVRSLATWYKNFAHILVVVSSAMAILSPKFQNLLTTASKEYLCVHYYLKYGEGKQALIGNLSNLVEKISETENNKYQEFEIHAYSFGSVISIDALFPSNIQQADLRISTEITRFVSIGCPVDFIRVYYPQYYSDRKPVNSSIKEWYNVNCEVDVLSSNFRNDLLLEDGDPAIVPGGMPVKNITYEVTPNKAVSWLDYLFLWNFKSHRMYWDDSTNGMNFFTNYINRLKTDKKN
jgi:hypothetical protein